MESLASGGVHVDVLQVPVPQTDDVAHHADDGGAVDVGHPRHHPGLRVGEVVNKPPGKDWAFQVFQNSLEIFLLVLQ